MLLWTAWNLLKNVVFSFFKTKDKFTQTYVDHHQHDTVHTRTTNQTSDSIEPIEPIELQDSNQYTGQGQTRTGT
ncbi:MAG: hypothetical protein ACI8RD_006223 [Bacillariaceae sp.]|jgi:hypothetical protein